MTTTAEVPTAADVHAAAARIGSPLGWRYVTDPMINTPDEEAGAPTPAAVLPMTPNGEETLTLVWDLARLARCLGEVTAAARDRWAAWAADPPHAQKTEALAADTTRCLSHATGIYALSTTRREELSPDPDQLPRLTRGLRC